MPEKRLAKTRATLPPGYQFGDAKRPEPRISTALDICVQSLRMAPHEDRMEPDEEHLWAI